MKKLLTLTMVLALSVAFTAGCKKKTEETTTTPPPAATETKPVQAPMSAKGAAAPAPEAPKAPEAPSK